LLTSVHFWLKTIVELLYLGVFLTKTTMTNTKNAMNFGAILGLSLCVVSAIFMSLGYFDSSYKELILSIVTIIIISWGTISFKEKENEGYISYFAAFKSCFLIVFYSSIILAFFQYLYFIFIDQVFIDSIIAKAENDLIQKQMSDEEVEFNMKGIRYVITPIGYPILLLFFNCVRGAIFALITAAFLKRDNPNFNNFIKENQ